jgi:glycine/D-amino acid oxidase-like deaminating enzyme
MRLRTVVVGAGAIGSCVAFRLSRTGVDVTVVDAALPGAGSPGGFAWIGASSPALRGYFDLNASGLAAHRRLGLELGGLPWLIGTGCLSWSSEPSRQAQIEGGIQALQASGYSALAFDPRRALELEPDIEFHPNVQTVAFFPDEGYVHVGPMIGQLHRAAQAMGATIRQLAKVVEIEIVGERARAVRLASGERLQADLVVLCCGYWTGEMVKLAGGELPMIPAGANRSAATGLIALTRPQARRVNRVLLADEIMIRPDGAGRLLLRSDAHDQVITANTPMPPFPAAASDLVDAASARLRNGDLQLESAHVALRALTADKLPAVGWLPKTEGVYVAVTHSGITLAPLLGELISREITAGGPDKRLDAFRPSRFETLQPAGSTPEPQLQKGGK